jgi:hypothetical protein
VLEIAERVLNNLQKDIVDSAISIAAGLEKGSSYSAPYQVLPYYEFPSHLPKYFNQNSMEINENSNHGDEAARIAYNDRHYMRR